VTSPIFTLAAPPHRVVRRPRPAPLALSRAVGRTGGRARSRTRTGGSAAFLALGQVEALSLTLLLELIGRDAEISGRVVAEQVPPAPARDVASLLSNLAAVDQHLAHGTPGDAAARGRSGEDRLPVILGRRAREERVAVADRVEGVRVAVADQRQPKLRGDARRGAASIASGRRRVEALQGIPVDERVGRQMNAHDGVLAHPQGEGGEGVRHDRQAALLVNLGDRGLEAKVAPQSGLKEDSQEVAAAGRDFLGDDDLDPTAALDGQALALDRRFDSFVVGDGDYVQVRVAFDVVENLGGRGGAVRGDRMDVNVGLTQARSFGQFHPASPVLLLAARSRSGQIGWKTASHCSGASEIIRSNSSASSRAIDRLRSRLLAPPGAGSGRRLPR
jgi:hypothetical protein